MTTELRMVWMKWCLMNLFTNIWDYLNKKSYSLQKNVNL